MAGQYFFIRSRLSGLVMDVDGGDRSPGTHVIMWEQKDKDISNANQLWYEDHNTGTIKSCLHDLCLSINSDNELVLHHFNNSSCMRWRRDGDKIRNDDDGQVIDISSENTDPGAKMCKWDDHGGLNQQWDFEYIDPRYFYIVSDMHNKVLDVSGAETSEGAEVIVWPRNDDQSENQLWFCRADGAVCSKLNGFALDSRDGDLRLYPAEDHNGNQGFQLQGNHITSRHNGKCVDINAASEDDGAHVCAWDEHDGENQKWHFDYV